jgi:hypothetical protein
VCEHAFDALADLSNLAAKLDGVTERRATDCSIGGTAAAGWPGSSMQPHRHPFVVRLAGFPCPIVPRDVLGATTLCQAHDDRRGPRERERLRHRDAVIGAWELQSGK